MNSNILTRKLTWKGALGLVAALGAALGLYYGSRAIFHLIPSRPKSPEAVKAELFAFLKDKSGAKNFEVPLKQIGEQEAVSVSNEVAAIRAEMASMQARISALQKELRTNREATAALQQQLPLLRTNLQTKQKELWPKQRELAVIQNGTAAYLKQKLEFQQQIQEAPSWEMLYKAFGQELWFADRLLSDTNLATRHRGLELVEAARLQAINSAENDWLAARICEAFIWPNLDLTDAKGSTLSRDQLLISAGLTFLQAGETNCYIKNSEMLISQTKSPVRADYARYQLGYRYELMGQYETALKLYRQIQSSNSMVYAARRIPIVESKLKEAKAGKK